VVASTIELSGAGGAQQGAEVVDADPRLGDIARGLLQDLVVHDVGAGVSGSAVLGDVALAPGSMSAVSSGVSGLYLSGSPVSSSPPII
jgi:hypothetical protein